MAEVGQEAGRNMVSVKTRGSGLPGGKDPLPGGRSGQIRISEKGQAHFPRQILRISNHPVVA